VYIISITKINILKTMTNAQEIFDKIKEKQKEQKVLRQIYRDVIANSQEYQNILEELDTIKNKKKKIEETLKSQLREEMDKLYAIKVDIESDKEILNQATLSKILKGEMVEIIDEYQNKYEPIFNVRFRKI
jgi:predicted nuclease with TOPRIM domain